MISKEHKKHNDIARPSMGNFGRNEFAVVGTTCANIKALSDAVIKKLSNEREGIVFMLWGNFAKKKAALIDTSKHLILEAAHPSPLAGGAFFGSKHFSKANQYLLQHGQTPIDWAIK